MSYHTMSPTSLPTPAPSTEILPGKRVSLTGQIDSAFSLPPAAIAGSSSDTTSVKSLSPVNSDSSYRPLSPPSVPSATSRTEKTPSATRRRSSAAASQANAANQNGYTIPPPPTRSRKIIQMKPRGQTEAQDESLDFAKNHPALAPSSQATNTKTTTTAAGSKRKQSSSGGPTTAAGRKIARKTAHSLIERRRRSKMNEEFGVLKDMIPACNGSDMHKLAILQASIEYMRYLEQCLGDLKSAHSLCQPLDPTAYQQRQQAPFRATPYSDATPVAGSAIEEDSDEDEEMSEAPSPHCMRPRGSIAASSTGYSHQPSISPAILPSSHASPLMTVKHKPSYSYYSANSSAQPSPAFEPQTQAGGPNYSSFSLTSPALGPQEGGPGSVKALEQGDHEATAALLMLNTDRRSWSGPKGGRGMSVKDLLSG